MDGAPLGAAEEGVGPPQRGRRSRGRGKGRGRGRAALPFDTSPQRDQEAGPSDTSALLPAAALPRLPDDPEDAFPDSIKVSSQSRVAGVAGKISHTLRQGGVPTLLATGSASINQAIKAIAVARKYMLEDGVRIAYKPLFRDTDHSRALLALQVVREEGTAATTSGPQLPDLSELTITEPTAASLDAGVESPSPTPQHEGSEGGSSSSATASPVAVVGGAAGSSRFVEIRVAARARHARVGGALAARMRENVGVVLLAVGVEAVSNAALATAHARFYLERDDIDMKVEVELVRIEKQSRELTAISLRVTPELE